MWLGFVNEADDQPASALMTRVLPVLALAGVGLLVLSGGKQEHAEVGPPPSSAAAARMTLAAAGGSKKAEDDAPEEDAAAAPPAAVPEPQPDERTAAEPDEAPTVEVAPAKPEPVAKPKREPKPPKPLSPAEARKAARAASGLRGALKDGRVRASNENFAMVTAGGEETGWDDAKAACSGLDVDGVRGWRLPSRGEAQEIQRAKVAPREAYWTRQRGPHDDTVFVHDPRTRRSSPWLDQEIASVVCVQPKPR